MEPLLFVPNILGAGKDVKRGSGFSVNGKIWPVGEGEVDGPFWKSPLELPGICLVRHYSVGWEVRGTCKPEVPMQGQLQTLYPPPWNDSETSKYLLEFVLSPRKQRTCRKHDSVLHLYSGSLTLIFGYSLLPGWTD